MKTLITAFVLTLVFAPTPLLGQEDAAESGWHELRPPGTRLFIHMPIEPKYHARTMTPKKGVEVVHHQYMATIGDDKHTAYFFNYHDLTEEPIGTNQIRKVLDDTVRGMVARVGGTLNTHDSITLLRNRGREAIFEFKDRQENDYVFHSRIYLRESRMYQLNVVSNKAKYSEEDALKFFESLKLKIKVNPPLDEAESTDGSDG